MNVAIRFARNLFVELLESPQLQWQNVEEVGSRIGQGWRERVKGETLKRETSRHLSVINFSCPFAFETNFSNYLVSVRGLPATSRERTRVIMARFISRGIHIPRYVSPSREDEEGRGGQGTVVIVVINFRCAHSQQLSDGFLPEEASFSPSPRGRIKANEWIRKLSGIVPNWPSPQLLNIPVGNSGPSRCSVVPILFHRCWDVGVRDIKNGENLSFEKRSLDSTKGGLKRYDRT